MVGHRNHLSKAWQNCADLAQYCGSLTEAQSTTVLISVLSNILESVKVGKIYYLMI